MIPGPPVFDQIAESETCHGHDAERPLTLESCDGPNDNSDGPPAELLAIVDESAGWQGVRSCRPLDWKLFLVALLASLTAHGMIAGTVYLITRPLPTPPGVIMAASSGSAAADSDDADANTTGLLAPPETPPSQPDLPDMPDPPAPQDPPPAIAQVQVPPDPVPTVDPPDITPLAFNDAPNVPDIAQAFEWKPSENALPRTNDVPPQFRVPGFPLPTTAPAVAVARTPAARPNPVVRAPRVAARGDGSGTGNGPGAQDGYDDRGLPKPEYPAESKRRHEQGLVTLDVEVKPDGRPGTITIVDDAGYPRLADAAIAAVRLATFEAATIDGVAVVGHIRIPFRFVLQQ